MLYGIAAIANSHVFVANAHYVIGDLRVWGWVTLIIAAVQLVAAGGVLMGNQLARWFAVAVVGLNAIDMMFFIPAYPFWALTIIAVDVVALWGLCAYGSRENLDAVSHRQCLFRSRPEQALRVGGIEKPSTGPVCTMESVPSFAGPAPGFRRFRRVSGSPVTSASDTSVPACAQPGERHARKELLITAPAVR